MVDDGRTDARGCLYALLVSLSARLANKLNLAIK